MNYALAVVVKNIKSVVYNMGWESKLKKEFLESFKGRIDKDTLQYKYETSNTFFIQWLEDRINKNLPPPTVWVVHWKDIFNIVEKPKILVYKHKHKAERIVEKFIANNPHMKDMVWIKEEHVRP